MRLVSSLAVAVISVLFAVSPAFASAGAEAAASGTNWALGMAALAMGIASAGGAIGQSIACSSALEGMSRNRGAADKMFTPMVLGLALIESLVLLTFVIVFLKF